MRNYYPCRCYLEVRFPCHVNYYYYYYYYVLVAPDTFIVQLHFRTQNDTFKKAKLCIILIMNFIVQFEGIHQVSELSNKCLKSHVRRNV